MRFLYFLSLVCLLPLICCSQHQEAPSEEMKVGISKSQLLAWCIVPYDDQERTPSQRINMLQELGFTQYAYDWRQRHLKTFAREITQVRMADIDIAAVWMWISADNDKPSALSADNTRLLSIMEENDLQTQLWVGIQDQFFEGLNEEEKTEKASEMIRYLLDEAKSSVTQIGLYNHGGWFGNPVNQIKLINSINDKRLGIVYNFHHAHAQIDNFPQLLEQMQPYLLAVNFNGMREEGPKILPIGQGNAEADMIKTLLESGYEGPIGILGHVENEDVRLVLERNLQGLDSLLHEMQFNTVHIQPN
jgi:sugar phosphate isomerase/epimerase